MSDVLLDRLLDVVEAVDLNNPDDDFVSAAFAMLALAISRLPETKRDQRLAEIEDGTLRKAVHKFPIKPSGKLN
jgi:hypothetical protein